MKLFCPRCTEKLVVDDGHAGTQFDCPCCAHAFVIPRPIGHAPETQGNALNRMAGMATMKLLSLVCAFLVVGGSVWVYSRLAGDKIANKQASQPKRPVVAATPIPRPQAKQPKIIVSATPVPVKAIPEPPQHVPPAGTLTKAQLLDAINKDARVYSGVWMDLLGAPAFTKPTGWSKLYCWKDKLDIGGDSPIGIAVEVADYKGDLIAVGVYDAESKSITPLPWRNKVVQAYNDAMQWYYNDQANQAAVAAQNRQLEIYKQAAAGAQRWERSQQSQYVSPLSASAVRVGSGNDDQPARENGTVFGTVGGSGTTQAAAYASAMSQLRAGWAPGKVPATGVPRFQETSSGWECHMDLTGNQ